MSTVGVTVPVRGATVPAGTGTGTDARSGVDILSGVDLSVRLGVPVFW